MILFHYISKDSALHRLSPITKVLGMLIIGLSTISLQDIIQDWLSFTILYSLIFFLFFKAKISFSQSCRDLRYFLTVIPLIIFFSSFKLQSNPELFLSHFNVSGLIFSSTFILKLYLFSLVSVLFIATTTVREINLAIEALLRKIPFVNSVRISTMISLCIVQIPVIFDLYQQIRIAQKARCLDNNRNPIRKIVIILNILIPRVLQNADSIALNYEAKCYSDVRTQCPFVLPKSDILFLSIFTLFCFIANLA